MLVAVGICGHLCEPGAVWGICTACYQRWRKSGYPFDDAGEPVVPGLQRTDTCTRPGCSSPVPAGRRLFCSIECCTAKSAAERECALPDCHERFAPHYRQAYHDPACKREARRIAARKQYRRKVTGRWIY